MATHGALSTQITEWNTLYFTWALKSQSIVDNTSTISWNFQLTAGKYGALESTANKEWSVVFDRGYTNLEQSYSGTNKIGIDNNETVSLASGTTVLKHNADGTRSFSVNCMQEFYIIFDNVSIITGEVSGRQELPTIAQKSTISAENGTLNVAQTITVTRQADELTHSIKYTCGSASGTVVTNSSDTRISWTPPLSLARQNTTGTSVPITLTCTTYANGTEVGTHSIKITCNIPASVKPSCSFKLTDINDVDDIYGSPVQGLSRIEVDVTATEAYGAAIEKCIITIDGATYYGFNATSGTLKTAGDSVVTATVTDERGRSGSVSYTMKVQAYTRPTVSQLIVHRTTEDGTESDQGEFIHVTFSAAISSLSGKNTAAYVLKYKQSTQTDYTEIAFSDLSNVYTVTGQEYLFAADSGHSYDVVVEATDRHSTTTKATAASTAFTVMHFHKSGTAVAFGKISEVEDTMEVALDAHFQGSTVIQGNRYSLSTPGEAGNSGYILMARIAITAANADTPITFVFSSRQREATMTVYVSLRNSTAAASSVGSIRYEGSNYGAFLVQTGSTTWELYVQKGSSYDTITLQDWYTSRTMESRVEVTFPGTLVGSLPGDYYRATPAMLDSLRDYIYPVGSVYISYSHVNPAQLFGGTWVRIENAFLWATTASGTIGQTGGEREHTLTTAEMPAHSHGSVYSQHAPGSKSYAWYTTAGSSVAYGAVSTGGGEAHNNMPPYIQVSVWRRTA